MNLEEYKELTIDDWYKMNHHDWKDVVNEYNDLLTEVKRLDKMFWDVEITNQKLHEENGDLKAQVDYYCTDLNTLENMNNDLKAEVKRLREGILNVMAGVYDNMYYMNQALDRVIQNES